MTEEEQEFVFDALYEAVDIAIKFQYEGYEQFNSTFVTKKTFEEYVKIYEPDLEAHIEKIKAAMDLIYK